MDTPPPPQDIVQHSTIYDEVHNFKFYTCYVHVRHNIVCICQLYRCV